MRHALSLPLLLTACLPALASCLGAEGKVRQGLVNAGLSQSVAACMAKPMAQQLSINQLMKLNSLGKAKLADSKGGYEALMHKLRALHDPEILSVTAAAAFNCTFR